MAKRAPGVVPPRDADPCVILLRRFAAAVQKVAAAHLCVHRIVQLPHVHRTAIVPLATRSCAHLGSTERLHSHAKRLRASAFFAPVALERAACQAGIANTACVSVAAVPPAGGCFVDTGLRRAKGCSHVLVCPRGRTPAPTGRSSVSDSTTSCGWQRGSLELTN